MTKNELLQSIISDLGANYSSSDSALLTALLDEVINDALLVSNRYSKAHQSDTAMNEQLTILQSHIRKCVKSIYLRRGGEDADKQAQSGITTIFENAVEVMTKDIIRSGKRLMR